MRFHLYLLLLLLLLLVGLLRLRLRVLWLPLLVLLQLRGVEASLLLLRRVERRLQELGLLLHMLEL